MGGYNWEVDAEVLCDWFRMPRDGEIPDVDDKSIAEFWKRISGREYKKGKQHKSTAIREPIWKIIHKFIGGIVFVRTSYGRLVSRMDLMVMIMIEQKKKIDWLWCVSRGLKDDQNDVSKNQGLGGGSFVTIIAKKLNFTFEGVESDKIDLTLKQMKARHILGKGNKWKHMGGGSDEEDDESEDDVDAPPPRAAPRTSSDDSKLDLILGRLTKLERYTSEHNKWEDDTLLAIASHLGISSTVGLPPRDPYQAGSPTPPSPPLFPTSSKGKTKVHDPPPMTEESVEASLKKVRDSVREISGEDEASSGEDSEG